MKIHNAFDLRSIFGYEHLKHFKVSLIVSLLTPIHKLNIWALKINEYSHNAWETIYILHSLFLLGPHSWNGSRCGLYWRYCNKVNHTYTKNLSKQITEEKSIWIFLSQKGGLCVRSPRALHLQVHTLEWDQPKLRYRINSTYIFSLV